MKWAELLMMRNTRQIATTMLRYVPIGLQSGTGKQRSDSTRWPELLGASVVVPRTPADGTIIKWRPNPLKRFRECRPSFHGCGFNAVAVVTTSFVPLDDGRITQPAFSSVLFTDWSPRRLRIRGETIFSTVGGGDVQNTRPVPRRWGCEYFLLAPGA